MRDMGRKGGMSRMGAFKRILIRINSNSESLLTGALKVGEGKRSPLNLKKKREKVSIVLMYLFTDTLNYFSKSVIFT